MHELNPVVALVGQRPVQVQVQVPLLRRLFSPVTLNGLDLPNRVLMSSMHLNLDTCPDAYERMARFYALRAREGVGLIVTAGCSPDEAGRAAAGSFSLDHDELIDAHRAITTAVHAEGGRVALQILHFGREGFHGGIVAPSAIRLVSSLFTPRALTEEGIQRTIAAHADCAARAMAAGYDAIELIFSQGFLVHEFLAPACNRREDRWGGAFENRARLAVAIAQAVRARVGPACPLIFRVPCMDLLEGGLPAHESLALVAALRPFGIDLLNVSIGWHESQTPTIAMVVPRAAFVAASRLVRQHHPDLKTAISNRINDPRDAEALLLEGDADVIALARPFLADPAWVRKARSNDFDGINTCIACNQSCLDYVLTGRPVGCSVNPDCNLPGEGHYPPLVRPLTRPLTVAVAGGGIAGMGAALYLARRGARVVLFEAATELGGQLRLAARIPDKAEFRETIRFHAQALLRAGVAVRLSSPFDGAACTAGHEGHPWDHVVLAHGSVSHRPGIEGEQLPHVLDYRDVLDRGVPVLGPVVIVGGGGVACDVAKFISAGAKARAFRGDDHLLHHAQGWDLKPYLALPAAAGGPLQITLLQRSSRKIAHRVGRTTRWIVLRGLQEAGATWRNGVDVVRIEDDGVLVRTRASGRESRLPARTVILAAGQDPAPVPLAGPLLAAVSHSVIGAAESAGMNITGALRAAYQLALQLR